MMTIKHITPSGEEFVYPATHVNYVPADAAEHFPGNPAPCTSLWRYDADGRAHQVLGGTAFVMNEHGKTVARYDLSASGPLTMGSMSRSETAAALASAGVALVS